MTFCEFLFLIHLQLNGDTPQNGENSESQNDKATKRAPTTKESASSSAKVSKKSNSKATDNAVTSENPVIDAKSVYDFTVNDTFGKDVPLEKYKGKVLLIVNIASRCGYTKKNYDELNTLQEQYKNKGN